MKLAQDANPRPATSAKLDGEPLSPPSPTTTVASISAMALAADGLLIVADWRNSRIHRLRLPEKRPKPSDPYNIRGLSTVLSEGSNTGQPVRVTALCAVDGGAWLAISRGLDVDSPVGLASVEPNGTVRVYEPDQLVIGSARLGPKPAEGTIWKTVPVETVFLTDLIARKDEILVSGLSGESFDSSLFRLPYPASFQDDAADADLGTVTKLEMFHTVHNQIETRAPIRAMTVIEDAAGKAEPLLVAAYTCTPLVTAPLSALDGDVVRTTTIAELGFGNEPVAALAFTLEHDGEASDWLLITHKAKSADLIALSDIQKASQGSGLSDQVKVPFQTTAGVEGIQLPMTGLIAISEQNERNFVAVRRDAETGDLEVVSYQKGAFFRLSDFINEYDFPDYEYDHSAFQVNWALPYHKHMRRAEDYHELVPDTSAPDSAETR